MDKINRLAALWKNAKNVVVLTGAGVSTASGLPDFRSKTGLWKQRPEALATLNALYNTPDEFYFFYQWRLAQLWKVKPNFAHAMLSDVEKHGLIKLLVTQNVDGLHQRAGSENVTELHGSMYTVSCLDCNAKYDSKVMVPEDIDWEKQTSEGYTPGKETVCPACGGKLRPDVVLFGESLPSDNWEKSVVAAKNADLMIVLGSSLLVGPANMLPDYAMQNGGKLAIINNDSTHLDNAADVVINDDIIETLEKVKKAMEDK